MIRLLSMPGELELIILLIVIILLLGSAVAVIKAMKKR